MDWSNRLYFGTWQLGGQFKNLSIAYIESLLLFAISSGIRRFDTAAVYGGGSVEKMLGACLPEDAVIVTKIPAIQKPNLASSLPINELYPLAHLDRSVEDSLCRIKRVYMDTVLLHNWLPSWSSDAADVLHHLQDMKGSGIVRRIGISLPDGFATRIDGLVLSLIDVIEAPFNSQERWILDQLPDLLGLRKEVLLRSLFHQGKLLKEGYATKEILRETLSLNTSVVIGMTTEKQITENINHLKGEQ